MSEPIISAHKLTHIYSNKHGGTLQKVALSDVTLDIARGSCAAIIGITGSGKSTLVQHFNGLLKPTSGTVIVDGIDIGAKGADLHTLRQRIGMLFQFPESQLFERTIFADVAFVPRRMQLSRREIRERVLHALDMVGLPPHQFAQRSPFDLSGCQKRRVALAGVLAMSPKVLILDEPTVGLDAEGRAEFYSYLKRIQDEGVTIVLVSHDMAEVATLADRLFVLHNGLLVMQGEPRSLFSQSERLGQYGLATPPLSELLSLLRTHGMAIPAHAFTLDEAFAAISSLHKLTERGERHV